MKIVFLALLSLLLIGCVEQKGEKGESGIDGISGVNGVDGEDGVDGVPGKDGKNGADGDDGYKLGTITLITVKGTTKTYLPDQSIRFKVPSNMYVLFGTGGNYRATIVAVSNNVTVKCVYQGQSTTANPTQGTLDYEKGRVYSFQKCISNSITDTDISNNTANYVNANDLGLVELQGSYKDSISINILGGGTVVGNPITQTILELIL